MAAMGINKGLLRHVKDRFGKLNPIETIVVEDVARGRPIVLASKKGNPRKLRPDLIRDILLNPNTYDLPDSGLTIDGGLFEAPLNLDGLTINHRVGFFRCQFKKPVSLIRASTRDLNFTGSTLNEGMLADGAHIRGSLLLQDGFSAKGEVRLFAANIAGNLCLSGAHLSNPSGDALMADRAVIRGSAFFRRGFQAKGSLRLHGTTIGGQLSLSGATLSRPGRDALVADRAKIGGGVYLKDGFSAKGEVRFCDASIDGQFVASGAQLHNPNGVTLNIERAQIGQSAFLNKAFTARGEVRLTRTRIFGQLTCQDAIFKTPKGLGLSAESLNVAGMFLWAGVSGKCAAINLADAQVHTLADSRASWTIAKKLNLDGFTYDTIAEQAAFDAPTRLAWLKRLENPNTPQPYEHLAKVLEAAGHVAAAKKILIAKQSAALKDIKKS